MIKFRLILIFVILCPFQQIPAQHKINFHSPENIKKFADYLFCGKDYLRASEEYAKYLKENYDDSVEFKSALALQRIGSYENALHKFEHISINSALYTDARQEYFRTMFIQKDFTSLQNFSITSDSAKPDYSFLMRLKNISLLLSKEEVPEEKSFISAFPFSENENIKKIYELKVNPPCKSPLLAGIMSAIIPGSGKLYTEDYTDGLFAAFLTGIFGYIAYTDFKADHNVRGWIFSGITAFFYSGNIYGSIASAQIYNAKIKFDFENELYKFLDTFKYLTGDYNFCR
jgi:hypothetical protein